MIESPPIYDSDSVSIDSWIMLVQCPINYNDSKILKEHELEASKQELNIQQSLCSSLLLLLVD